MNARQERAVSFKVLRGCKIWRGLVRKPRRALLARQATKDDDLPHNCFQGIFSLFLYAAAMQRLTRATLIAAASLIAAPNYHVIDKIKIGGATRWDYITVDPDTHRAYVSNATRAVVVDLEKGSVVGEVPDTKGIHGIALAPKLNRGYTSNGQANNVTVFDLKTLKPVETVATGQNPDAIYFDAGSERVLTFNGRSSDSTVIDAKTNKVVATIPVGGKPEFAQGDGKGTVYANIETTNEVVVIDAKAAKITKRYKLEGCDEPSGLAFDQAHSRLFSVCGNKVMAISDPAAGKLVTTVPIGEGADGVAFDPGPGYAFSSNGGDGNITVVGGSGSKYSVMQTATTQKSARTIAVDTKTHKLYLPAGEPGTTTDKKGRPSLAPDSFELLVVGQ